MAARVQLHNFRFSIYIDADGTVTLTDLPPELRDVVAALDPYPSMGGQLCHLTSPSQVSQQMALRLVGQRSEDLG